MKKFVIIDGNAIIHRCYHALPKTLKAPSGELTNAVYGFTSILLGILEYEKPDYLAVAWDMKGPTFRHEEMESYKATRAKTDDELIGQFPLTRSVLEAMEIPQFGKEGLEADDFLGMVAADVRGHHSDVAVVIVTGDQDAFQLVRDGVTVVTPVSGYKEVKRYDREAVKAKMGVWPEQVADYKGLCGDSSDNLLGVPGIGKKTATSLLEKFGSVEGIYSRLSEVMPERIRSLLNEHEKEARQCKRMATILSKEDGFSVDLGKCAVHEFSMDNVRELFGRMAFRSLLGRVEVLDKEWSKRRAEEKQVSLF
ncbi:hypothetical protein KKC94_04680 [Patescibacteria group bacterium]|nr:hypothetical protein [Patescibacteria group bacterium]